MRLTIQKKIMLATGIVFSIVVIMSLLGIWNLGRVGAGAAIIRNYCSENLCLNIDVIQEVKFSLEKALLSIHDYVNSANQNKVKECEKMLNALKKDMEKALNMVRPLEDHQQLNLVRSFSKVQKGILEIESLSHRLLADPDIPRKDAEYLEGKIDFIAQGVVGQLNYLLNYYLKEAKVSLDSANKLWFNSFLIMVLIFLSLAAATLTSGLILSHKITKPIHELVEATERISCGDLTAKVKISSSDEIGDLAIHFNTMVEDLRRYQGKLVANERLATLGTFVSYVSHELKNPLSILINCVAYLEKHTNFYNGGAIFEKYFTIMKEELDRANRIIHDCLHYAKDKRLDLRMTNLNDLLEKIFSLTGTPEYIHLKRELQDDLPSIMADEYQIRQVFVNIITNSIMAMAEQEQGEIKIATRLSGDGFIEIEFTDTGPGIAEQNLLKVFDPFFTTKRQGTGLGLAICKFIVEKHYGLIWAENANGGGTSFFIRLPAKSVRESLDPDRADSLVLS